MKKLLAILMILILVLSGVVPVFGRDTESQALSAQDMATLSSMGFYTATEADRAEAAAAGATFVKVATIAEVHAILSANTRAASGSSTAMSSVNGAAGNRWFSCEVTWFFIGINMSVEASISGSGDNRRFGSVINTAMSLIGFHPFTWLHETSQSTWFEDGNQTLKLQSFGYLRQGIEIGDIFLVRTLGPASHTCPFYV